MSSRSGERSRGGGGAAGPAMPRVAASRSRSEKSRSVTVVPLPHVSVDIIPGRFTEDDWMMMVSAEDGEDVVGDLVDTLMERVMEESLMVHLQRQLVPYTVAQARDAMLQMVRWAFVARDEGDHELDTGGSGQEEPLPCPHDSWAQGCVPITLPQVSPRPHVIPEEEAPQPEEPPRAEDAPPEGADTQPSAPETPQPIIKPTPPTVPPKSRPRYRPHRGPLRSAGLKDITKSLEETEKEMFLEEDGPVVVEENVALLPTSLHNILKIQLGRPPQKKDVIYDHQGNVLSVPKVALSRLPQHHVRPRVQVLDVSRESTSSQRRSRLQHLRGGRAVASGSPHDTAHLHTTSVEDLPGQAPEPPAILLDTMPLTQGVILRAGNATERGSMYSLRQREGAIVVERPKLRPIKATIPRPSLSVEQLLRNSAPQVQPLISFMSH